MDPLAAEYSKLQPKRFPARELRETAEGRYWKGFSLPSTVKQFGAVTSLDFASEKPHYLAVTSSTRVIIYDRLLGVRRTIGRFKDKAYGGTFRADGKLLAAGGEDGIVQVFDTNSRSLLRRLTGHRRPVHSVTFAQDKQHLISGGDDATVRLWDIASGAQVARLDGHSDYVRALAVSPSSHDVWATGGYDHICKIWDARTQGSTISMNHGAPIESLAFFPSESMLVTAGGAYLCCWDLYSGGRLLHKFAAHQKTVTSVLVQRAVSTPSSDGSLRILSSSLDGHVKVFDPEVFKLTHASKYPSPILSLAVAPDNSSFAVGMADGTLSLRRRRQQKILQESATAPASRKRYAPRLTASSFRYFIRGQSAKAAASDFVVAARRKVKLADYDRLLRRFRYKEALDSALSSRRPEVVSGVVEELVTRGALSAALSGRDAEGLLPVVDHMAKYIRDPRHTQMLCAVGHRLLDAYTMPGDSGTADVTSRGLLRTLNILQERANAELGVQDDLISLKGMLDSLLAAGSFQKM
ncbi:hypothetical protein Ndes2437A_g06735 [Nannochloris sp. 'desiccata']